MKRRTYETYWVVRETGTDVSQFIELAPDYSRGFSLLMKHVKAGKPGESYYLTRVNVLEKIEVEEE